jgi:hypothetical protein
MSASAGLSGPRLTASQAKALASLRDYGDPGRHLVGKGQSYHGGFNSTLFWLRQNGLMAYGGNSRFPVITDRGKRSLEAGRLAPPPIDTNEAEGGK